MNVDAEAIFIWSNVRGLSTILAWQHIENLKQDVKARQQLIGHVMRRRSRITIPQNAVFVAISNFLTSVSAKLAAFYCGPVKALLHSLYIAFIEEIHGYPNKNHLFSGNPAAA